MENNSAIICLVILTMMLSAVKRNFTPSENRGNPIHWFRLKVGSVCNIDLHQVTFGVLGDFAEEMQLAVPQNEKDWATKIAALVVCKGLTIQPDGHEWIQGLIMQNAAVNDLMDYCIENGELVKGPTWADSYSELGRVTVNHFETEHGNRTRYQIKEAAQ